MKELLGVPAWTIQQVPLVRLETKLREEGKLDPEDEKHLNTLYDIMMWHVDSGKEHTWMNLLPTRIQTEFKQYVEHAAIKSIVKLSQLYKGGPDCTYDTDIEHPVCLCCD
jgi:hypothetical protein